MIRRVRLDQRESKKSKKGDINKRAGFPPTRGGIHTYSASSTAAGRFPRTRGGDPILPATYNQQNEQINEGLFVRFIY